MLNFQGINYSDKNPGNGYYRMVYKNTFANGFTIEEVWVRSYDADLLIEKWNHAAHGKYTYEMLGLGDTECVDFVAVPRKFSQNDFGNQEGNTVNYTMELTVPGIKDQGAFFSAVGTLSRFGKVTSMSD